jgi:hypothetical protein
MITVLRFPYAIICSRSPVVQTIFFAIVDNDAIITVFAFPRHIQIYRDVPSDRFMHFKPYIVYFVSKAHVPKNFSSAYFIHF